MLSLRSYNSCFKEEFSSRIPSIDVFFYYFSNSSILRFNFMIYSSFSFLTSFTVFSMCWRRFSFRSSRVSLKNFNKAVISWDRFYLFFLNSETWRSKSTSLNYWLSWSIDPLATLAPGDLMNSSPTNEAEVSVKHISGSLKWENWWMREN